MAEAVDEVSDAQALPSRIPPACATRILILLPICAPALSTVIHLVDRSLSPRTPVVDQYEAGAPLSSLNLTGGC